MMRIILSAAISADGYIDSFGDDRLILSSPEDWRAIHALRAECDAILVGAATLRQDNPSLVIRDEKLRRKRLAEGRTADIMKVTVSGSGQLDPNFRFFTDGEGERIVFTHGTVCGCISELATVISRPELTATTITSQLRKMNVGTLMVEGGSSVLSMFLRERNWDEFRLAVAPIFVGDERAPRLVLDGEYPPMTLIKTERLGQTAVMHFVNRSQYRVDCHYLLRAMDNSLNSNAGYMRYRVGAVVVTKDGKEFDGYTGEMSEEDHAEEVAIYKAVHAGADLKGATIYTTIEPCSRRKSKPEPCADLILSHNMARVVFALREPDRFVRCEAVRKLLAAGLEVVEMTPYAPDIIRINSHVLS